MTVVERALIELTRRVAELVEADAPDEPASMSELDGQADDRTPRRRSPGLPLTLQAARALLADAREQAATVEGPEQAGTADPAPLDADHSGTDVDAYSTTSVPLPRGQKGSNVW
jgi:hypothetical protein